MRERQTDREKEREKAVYINIIIILFNLLKVEMGFNKAHKLAQRLHRERSQPDHRKKFGYLEKKADYKKRALDHQIKAKRIKKLKNKALDRNPNEFNFHMINSRLVDGVHTETVKPMAASIKKKIEKKEELVKRYNQRINSARRHKSFS